ncbi:MAG: class I SAM-dependent methyltransferase [Elusimicrobia bacterium]|nr:class I SAM-dependent methyltransferase [Elusimicrobiota bacterium]
MMQVKDNKTYRLLDSGNFRKLEQVGEYLLDRPAPQAIWQKRLGADAWKKADAYYERSSSGGGKWKYAKNIPEGWMISYGGLSLRVRLTDFGHLGFFAEHSANWSWIRKKISESHPRSVRVLNMFAYTGGASLAAASAGAQVTHLDAAKGIVQWARENAQESGLADKPVRWIVDDAMKFITREAKRESRYDAVILDPPSFGRGKKGEVWKFETDVPRLLDVCAKILTDRPLFVILSAHTPGFSGMALRNLLEDMMRGHRGKLTCGEMTVPENGSARMLPSGISARWEKA